MKSWSEWEGASRLRVVVSGRLGSVVVVMEPDADELDTYLMVGSVSGV